MNVRPRAAELTCTLIAALLELVLEEDPVLEEPSVLPVLAWALLEVHVKLPWMTPLPPEEPGASFLRVVQESEMSPVDEISKVPLTSDRAGNATLETYVNIWVEQFQA